MDHHEKLAWSTQHLHALDLEIKKFLEEHKFTARAKQRDGTRQFDIIVNEMPLLPAHWPLMAGDAIQNMRGGLDHLIWALTARSPTQPNPTEAQKIGFPICTSEGRYWGVGDQRGNGTRKRQAGWIGDPALAIVDRCQPYLRGNLADEHPLAVIASYSNEDKHRNLVASAVLFTAVQFTFDMTGTDRQMILTGFTFAASSDRRLYTGANLGVLEFAEGTTCEAAEVVVKPVFTGDVAFGMKRPAPMFRVADLEKVLDRLYGEVIVPLDELLW